MNTFALTGKGVREGKEEEGMNDGRTSVAFPPSYPVDFVRLRNEPEETWLFSI